MPELAHLAHLDPATLLQFSFQRQHAAEELDFRLVEVLLPRQVPVDRVRGLQLVLQKRPQLLQPFPLLVSHASPELCLPLVGELLGLQARFLVEKRPQFLQPFPSLGSRASQELCLPLEGALLGWQARFLVQH